MKISQTSSTFNVTNICACLVENCVTEAAAKSKCACINQWQRHGLDLIGKLR